MKRSGILVLTPQSCGGGAQRVVLLLATHLAMDYETHLGIVLSEAPSVEFPDRVFVHRLSARRVRGAAWSLLLLVWRLRPTVVLSGMAHLNFLVLLLRVFFPPRTRVLVRQNGTVSAALAADSHPHLRRALYRLLYPHASRILCQSEAMAEDLARELRVDRSRLRVLPNPIEIDAVRAAEPLSIAWREAGPHLLAIGRLAPEKGFDLLLTALVTLRGRFPHMEVAIAGMGGEETRLRALAEELNLQDRVHFLGAVPEPARLFSSPDLFVLSSRHEGMPNALLEAAAAGLPLVALPACGGVVDLLRGQEGCWMAKEISAVALADALSAALSRLSSGERFAHAWIERFRASHSARACSEMIAEVLVGAHS